MAVMLAPASMIILRHAGLPFLAAACSRYRRMRGFWNKVVLVGSSLEN